VPVHEHPRRLVAVLVHPGEVSAHELPLLDPERGVAGQVGVDRDVVRQAVVPAEPVMGRGRASLLFMSRRYTIASTTAHRSFGIATDHQSFGASPLFETTVGLA
jgi:hypothetical protein